MTVACSQRPLSAARGAETDQGFEDQPAVCSFSRPWGGDKKLLNKQDVADNLSAARGAETDIYWPLAWTKVLSAARGAETLRVAEQPHFFVVFQPPVGRRQSSSVLTNLATILSAARGAETIEELIAQAANASFSRPWGGDIMISRVSSLSLIFQPPVGRRQMNTCDELLARALSAARGAETKANGHCWRQLSSFSRPWGGDSF